MAGSFAESPREVHRPYGQLAERCQQLTITGNTITDATNEDWGAVAIALGYVRHCTISKNHVLLLSYSASASVGDGRHSTPACRTTASPTTT